MPKRPKKTRPSKPKDGEPSYQVSWWTYHPDCPVANFEELMKTVSIEDGVQHPSARFPLLPTGCFRCAYVWAEKGTNEPMNRTILLHVASRLLGSPARIVRANGCSVISAANRRGLLAWDSAAEPDPQLLADMMDLGCCSTRVIRAFRSSLSETEKARACDGVATWINELFRKPEWHGWRHFLAESGYGEILIREDEEGDDRGGA